MFVFVIKMNEWFKSNELNDIAQMYIAIYMKIIIWNIQCILFNYAFSKQSYTYVYISVSVLNCIIKITSVIKNPNITMWMFL